MVEAFPWIPGWDLAGTVETAGPDVEGLAPGDEVSGMTWLPDGGSTWAEAATVTADAVRLIPDGLTTVEAAALPQVALTPLYALDEVIDLQPDDRLLVLAAAGGVGHVAVQLAAAWGAEVVGTASSSNAAFLQDLGVDDVVDYRARRFEEEVDGVDAVLDGVGGDVLERSARVTREDGVIVTLPSEPPADLVERLRTTHAVETRHFGLLRDGDPSLLDRVTCHVEAGTVQPFVSRVYPLEQASEALAESEAGHVRGKLVLDVAGAE